MAGHFADTCGDDYNTAQLSRYWDVLGTDNAPVVGAFGRFGGQGIRLDDGGVTTGSFVGFLVPGLSRLIVGIACNHTGINGDTRYRVLIGLSNSVGVQLTLRHYFDGSLKVFRGATELASVPAAFGFAQYHYVEMDATIDNAAGAVAVRVDNVQIINLVGVDTQEQAAADITLCRIGGIGTNTNAGTSTLDIDDVYALTATGAPNSFLGDTRMTPLFPTGAGFYTEWTPLAGNNWDNVNDNPADDDATYNIGDTVGERDTYAMSDLSAAAGATIHAVVLNIVARKDDAGTREISGKIRQAGVDANGVNIPLTAAYKRHPVWFPTDPSAAAWSVAKVNSMEAGAEVEV